MEDKIFRRHRSHGEKDKNSRRKRKTIEENIGYVLVDMIVTDNSWYVVGTPPRVTGFVSARDDSCPFG